MEQVYTNPIRQMGEELGLTIRRADDIFSPRPFMEKVWNGICTAKLILADCTQKNPNVFYEIGVAHAVGRRVVLITRSEDGDRGHPPDLFQLSGGSMAVPYRPFELNGCPPSFHHRAVGTC